MGARSGLGLGLGLVLILATTTLAPALTTYYPSCDSGERHCRRAACRLRCSCGAGCEPMAYDARDPRLRAVIGPQPNRSGWDAQLSARAHSRRAVKARSAAVAAEEPGRSSSQPHGRHLCCSACRQEPPGAHRPRRDHRWLRASRGRQGGGGCLPVPVGMEGGRQGCWCRCPAQRALRPTTARQHDRRACTARADR
jgi:hypothetical protein